MVTINRTHFKRYIQHLICEQLQNKLIAHYNHDRTLSPSEFNETNADGTKSRYQIWSMAELQKFICDSDGADTLPPVKLKVLLTFGENQIPLLNS